ncbi:LuxR family transcriptional regulator [Streptomyces sp. NPDC005345]|uniref:LuxR family transcriptional regulator n=1 Tax=Streptomyces sp. NPDC005345 TaxID=3156877 RepID=UPI0033BA83ED
MRSIRLDASSGPKAGSPELDAKLVGRSREVTELRAFLATAASRGAALAFSGPAGVGRSALLDMASSMACRSGALVLHAAGAQFESNVEFACLSQLLYPLRKAARIRAAKDPGPLSAAVGYDLGEGSGETASIPGIAAQLLRETCGQALVLLAVDDLQWVDASSAAVLEVIARRAEDLGVGFIGACRSDTPAHFDSSAVAVLDVPPLKPPEALSLVRSRFPQMSSSSMRQVVAESEGYPLTLVELASALEVESSTDCGPDGGLPFPPRLRRLFSSVVRDLPDSTRQALLLEALAAQDPGPRDRLAASSTDLLPAVQAQLVTTQDQIGSVTFTHPLIRTTLIACSTSAERRQAHSDLARLSERRPESCAWHLAEAADRPSEALAAVLESNATAALRRGAAGEAMARALRSAELSPDAAERARRLARAAYMKADVSGDLKDASAMLLAAREGTSGTDSSLQSAVAAAYVLLNEGDVDAAHRLLAAALDSEELARDASRDTLLSALHTLMLAAFFGGRPELWPPFQRALARLKGDIPSDLACMANTFPDPARTGHAALPLLDPILRGLKEEEDPAQIVRIAEAVFYLDRLEDCRDGLWKVIRNGREGGAVASSLYALIVLSFADFQRGSWDTAQQLADEAEQLCGEHGYHILAWPARLAQALLAAARGYPSVVSEIARGMANWSTSHGGHTIKLYAHHARELSALGHGDFDEAYRQVTAISPPGDLPPYRAHALWVPMDLVEAAVHIGRYAEARAHVEAVTEAGIASLSPRLALVVAGSAAMAADHDDAVELFEAALAIPSSQQWPFERARIQAAYGQRLRRLHRTLEAREHLGAAAATFDYLGARSWRARILRELQATGLRRGGATADRGSLTPREREIASLAATGLGNKQIAARLLISPRTVAAHLRNVFPKLGLTSRAALRDRLDALDLDG